MNIQQKQSKQTNKIHNSDTIISTTQADTGILTAQQPNSLQKPQLTVLTNKTNESHK